ncbi:MAG: lipoprotein [Proteobacteria bacterium]|nr:lipoprotein [Pseudomonadota bacterium]
MRQYLAIAFLCASALLGGCGTKGPLTLPPPGTPTPAPQPADLSTPASPAR